MTNLITLNEYKELENIANPKDDARTETIITSVSQLIKTYCGNSIVDYYTNAKVEKFTIKSYTTAVQLTESPVIATGLIAKEKNAGDSAYTTLTEDTDYDIEFSDFYITRKKYLEALKLYEKIEAKIGITHDINFNKFLIAK